MKPVYRNEATQEELRRWRLNWSASSKMPHSRQQPKLPDGDIHPTHIDDRKNTISQAPGTNTNVAAGLAITTVSEPWSTTAVDPPGQPGSAGVEGPRPRDGRCGHIPVDVVDVVTATDVVIVGHSPGPAVAAGARHPESPHAFRRPPESFPSMLILSPRCDHRHGGGARGSTHSTASTPSTRRPRSRCSSRWHGTVDRFLLRPRAPRGGLERAAKRPMTVATGPYDRFPPTRRPWAVCTASSGSYPSRSLRGNERSGDVIGLVEILTRR